MKKNNTLEYLRLLNESSKDNLKINNKNIIDILIDSIEFNKNTYSENDKYLYIYNYINIFREYYDILKEKIKNEYSKLTQTLNKNNESLIENEIELIKYYRGKIFEKKIEDSFNKNNTKIINNSDQEIDSITNTNYLMDVYDNLDSYMDDMCNIYKENNLISKNISTHEVPNNDLIKFKNKKDESDILYVKNGNKRIKLNNNIIFCN